MSTRQSGVSSAQSPPQRSTSPRVIAKCTGSCSICPRLLYFHPHSLCSRHTDLTVPQTRQAQSCLEPLQGSFFLQIPPTGPCSNPLSRRAPSCPYPLKRAHYLLCPPALFLFSILTASCCYFWSHPLEGMLHHPVLFTIGETGGCGRWRPLQGVGLIRGPGFPLGGHDYCGEPSGKSPPYLGSQEP